MEVSWNGGNYDKNGWFGGNPILGNLQMVISE
jgi:hypothetical protein